MWLYGRRIPIYKSGKQIMINKSILILLAILISLSGCKSFMYGYTKDLAFDAYHIVKSDKKDFGNKRIRYNMGLRKNSELYFFC